MRLGRGRHTTALCRCNSHLQPARRARRRWTRPYRSRATRTLWLRRRRRRATGSCQWSREENNAWGGRQVAGSWKEEYEGGIREENPEKADVEIDNAVYGGRCSCCCLRTFEKSASAGPFETEKVFKNMPATSLHQELSSKVKFPSEKQSSACTGPLARHLHSNRIPASNSNPCLQKKCWSSERQISWR
jgi:hypothetical protein